MNKFIKGEDIYTALIPLGAKNESDVTTETELYDQRLTISSLPDSTDGTITKVNDYIYDTEAVKKWGWIWKVIKWDDVTVAENLLTKAKEDLTNAINPNLTLELTVIDLHELNVDIDRINLGDKIQCVSLPHNLNIILVVKSMSIDIDDPSKTVIKLVLYSKQLPQETSISSGNKNTEKTIVAVQESLQSGYPTYADMNYALNDIREDLSDYAKIVDVNNAFSELATALRGV